MSDKEIFSSSEAFDPDVEVIGETGGTVVYVFPGGNAGVKKGKKLAERLEEGAKLSNSSQAPSISSAVSKKQNAARSETVSPRSQSVTSPANHSPAKASGQTAQPQFHCESMPTATDAEALAQTLVSSNLISPMQLQVAQYDVSASGMSLLDVLVARGWISKETVASML